MVCVCEASSVNPPGRRSAVDRHLSAAVTMASLESSINGVDRPRLAQAPRSCRFDVLTLLVRQIRDRGARVVVVGTDAPAISAAVHFGAASAPPGRPARPQSVHVSSAFAIDRLGARALRFERRQSAPSQACPAAVSCTPSSAIPTTTRSLAVPISACAKRSISSSAAEVHVLSDLRTDSPSPCAGLLLSAASRSISSSACGGARPDRTRTRPPPAMAVHLRHFRQASIGRALVHVLSALPPTAGTGLQAASIGRQPLHLQLGRGCCHVPSDSYRPPAPVQAISAASATSSAALVHDSSAHEPDRRHPRSAIRSSAISSISSSSGVFVAAAATARRESYREVRSQGTAVKYILAC